MANDPETDAGLLRGQLPAGSLRHFHLQEALVSMSPTAQVSITGGLSGHQ